MKKFLVIFIVVLVFMFVNVTYGQDCGKCPSKCKAFKKEKPAETKVYVSENDKMYHQKDCKVVKAKDGYKTIVLGKAKKSGKTPCAACHPVKKAPPATT